MSASVVIHGLESHYHPFRPQITNKTTQDSRKFRQELSRAVQAQSKIDPDTDDFREAVERAMMLLSDSVLDEPVGVTPESAYGTHLLEA